MSESPVPVAFTAMQEFAIEHQNAEEDYEAAQREIDAASSCESDNSVTVLDSNLPVTEAYSVIQEVALEHQNVQEENKAAQRDTDSASSCESDYRIIVQDSKLNIAGPS